MSPIRNKNFALQSLRWFFLAGLLGRMLVSGKIYYWSNYLFLAWFSLAYLLALLCKKTFFPMPNTLKLGLGFFFGASIISLPLGIHHLTSARELVVFLGYLFVLLAATEIIRPGKFAAASWTILLAATAHSVFALTQYFGGLSRSVSFSGQPELELLEQVSLKRIFGLTFSPDFLACLLAASLILLFGEGNELLKKWTKSPWLRALALAFLAALFLAPLIMTRSFGGFLSFTLGALCLILIKARKNFPARQMAIAIFAGLIIAGAVLASFVYHRRAVLFKEQGNPVALRLYNFASGLKVYSEKPFFGVGLGNFWIAYPKYRPAGGNETRYVHNNFIQVLAESGPLAEIGLLILAGFSLWPLRRVLGGKEFSAVSLLPALVVLLSHWLWDYGLYVPELASIFFVLLAGTASAASDQDEPKISRPMLFLTTLLSALLWAASLWLFLEQRAVKSAENFFRQADFEQAGTYALKALNLLPADDYAEMLVGWSLSSSGQGPSQVVPHFQRAIQLNPRFAFWPKHLGDYYLSIGKIEPAQAEYRKALALYPESPELLARMAKVRRLQGDLKSAEIYARAGLEKSGDRRSALWEMFWIKSSQDKKPEAASVLRELAVDYRDPAAQRLLAKMESEKTP